MSTIVDLQRSAQQFAEIANRAFVNDEQMRRIAQQVTQQVNEQVRLSESALRVVKAQQDMVGTLVQRWAGPLQRATDGILQTVELQRASAKAISEFLSSVPSLLASIPQITDQLAVELPKLEGFRAMLERLPDVDIPDEHLDFDSLSRLRREARSAVENEDPLGDVVQTMKSLEEIDETANTRRDANSRSNVIWVVAVIQILLAFLANQDAILKNTFEDAAWLGSVLARVWPYAVGLILYLLVSEA